MEPEKKKVKIALPVGEKFALTIPEAIEFSSLGRNSVYDAINAGKLKIRKFGTKTLVLREDLESFLRKLPGEVMRELAPKPRARQAA